MRKAITMRRQSIGGLPTACLLTACFVGAWGAITAQGADNSLRDEAQRAMHKAATYYATRVASHGGYVYHYSLDLAVRWGEGRASPDQIWVQPPGTPTVGLAFLQAYRATGDKFYLDAATKAA